MAAVACDEALRGVGVLYGASSAAYLYLDGAYIAHLAGSWFSYLASTFLVGGPQIPKDPGFGGFRPIPVPLVPSIWPENACVMPNSKIRLPKFLASKIRCNGFFELNQMVVRTPQVTYSWDP